MIKKQKKIFLMFLVFSLFILAVGCSNQESAINNPTQETGMLQVSIPIDENLLANASLQSVTDNITLSKIIVTVTNNSTEESQIREAVIKDGLATVGFGKLAVGSWSVLVEALDNDDAVVYSGSGTANITYNSTTPVTINMELTPGDLDIKVIVPENVDINSGTVTLIDPAGNKEQELDNNFTISFNDIEAKTWPVQIVLKDSTGNTIVDGKKLTNITVLPGKTTVAEVNYNEGSISISINWQIAPKAPINLSAISSDGTAILSWDDNNTNIDGYLVYRSDYSLGNKELLTNTLVTTNTYTDENVEYGEEYWYWVQAYSSDGISSDLSESKNVTIKHEGSDYLYPKTAGKGIKFSVTSYENTYEAFLINQGDLIEDTEYVQTISTPFEKNNAILELRKNDKQYYYSGTRNGITDSIYMYFSIPREFTSGNTWSSMGDNHLRNYHVDYIGTYELNGSEYEDCIKVNIEIIADDPDFALGSGYFIAAKGIGIIEMVFNQDNGNTATYQYVEELDNPRNTISGTVTKEGILNDGMIVSISGDLNYLSDTTDEDGNFSIDFYGDSTVLRFGEDLDSNGRIDPYYHYKFVDNITSDINYSFEINELEQLDH